MGSGNLTRWIDWLLMRPLRYILEKPERALKDYVTPGMTVLDVGCGEGLYSLGMARLVGPNGCVVSVDTRAAVIDTLRLRAARAGVLPRMQLRICSEQDLAIDDLIGQVDFALAVYVIHHAQNAGLLMRNVYRALRPGGTFLVVEPRHHASATEREATESAAKETGFTVVDHPKLRRDWAVRLEKPAVDVTFGNVPLSHM
jgi:ubiquinone/menaquinone biosynthesis C-methylase UbiE